MTGKAILPLYSILECEVKWVLESITTNKASGGEEFQVSYLGKNKTGSLPKEVSDE